MRYTVLQKWVILALILAFFVVMLGAYTRLTDAGLGCPDWPGCYGRMVLPESTQALSEAQASYPAIPLESRKAWTEMIHRYIAGTLGLLILFIAFSAIRLRWKEVAMPWKLPLFLMIFVFFQAALGMWTVTLKLLPVVVMSHLLGGMIIVSCLALYSWQLSRSVSLEADRIWRYPIIFGCFIVFFQIALGGWVSANYAGLACTGFPQCNGMWWPQLDFREGFYLFAPVGENYQGGLLAIDARMTIQFIHRMGAMITALYIGLLSLLIMVKAANPRLRQLAMVALALVGIQFGLGILNVLYLLPLSIAVAHNGVAALLLATMVSLVHFTDRSKHAI